MDNTYNNFNKANLDNSTFKTFAFALLLVKEAIEDEKADEMFYDYLISKAPSVEQKDLIVGIRDDERKHHNYFMEIYKHYIKDNEFSNKKIDFIRPDSYILGIKKAKLGELNAVKKYRDIYSGLPSNYYRGMLFEIITDELIHAHKYDLILYLNRDNEFRIQKSRKTFTTEEAKIIAKQLGIDFSKVKFDIEQFRKGLDVELEHGSIDPLTNVTNDDPILTGKIALAHLNELSDYYTRLDKIEKM